MYDMILKGGTCVTPAGIVKTDVAIRNGKIAFFGDLSTAQSDSVMDVSGLHVLPGVVNPYVSLQESLLVSTAGAALGGVATLFGSNQALTDGPLIADICREAKDQIWTDIAFFAQLKESNFADMNEDKVVALEAQQGVSALQVMAQDVDDTALMAMLASSKRRMLVDLGGQDAAYVMRFVKSAKTRVNMRGIKTLEEVTHLSEFKNLVSVECSLEDLRDKGDLWYGVDQAIVDSLASSNPQVLVPVMLNHVNEGRLSLEHFVDLCSAGPCRTYNVACKGRLAVGYDADFSIVDMAAERTITDKWIASHAGQTPYEGMKVKGWPISTIVRGNVVMHEGELIANPQGKAVKFTECL